MFEMLFVHWHVDPVIFHLGGMELRWYSLLFVSGFILGWYIFRYFFRREQIDENLLDSLLFTLLIATIVGARLGHCLFYQPDYYLGSWEGAFIRLGNLFNSEIYGDVTNLPWGFIFDLRGETEPKHPTQLYEAGCYLLLGLFLMGLYRMKLDKVYRGTFIGLFFIGCFGARFLIEFIKEPQVGFEEGMALNMGQLLSIPFILLGIGFLVYAWKKKLPARAVHPQKPARTETHYAHAK